MMKKLFFVFAAVPVLLGTASLEDIRPDESMKRQLEAELLYAGVPAGHVSPLLAQLTVHLICRNWIRKIKVKRHN